MSTGQSFLGYNMYAYCFNNPVNMSDSGGMNPWYYEKDSAKSAYISGYNRPKTVSNNSNKNTLSGDFKSGIVQGSGSLTFGYSDFNWRLNDKIESSGAQDGWIGGFGKVSVGNANGKIGIGNDNFIVSLKGVADGLVGTAQAGLHYKEGFGIGAKAKASVLSGRVTMEFDIYDWQVELGVSGELLSIGAEATYGIFPSENGGKELKMNAGISTGPYGLGYVIRIKSPY